MKFNCGAMPEGEGSAGYVRIAIRDKNPSEVNEWYTENSFTSFQNKFAAYLCGRVTLSIVDNKKINPWL